MRENPYKADVGGCQPGWHAKIWEEGYKQGRRELIEWLKGKPIKVDSHETAFYVTHDQWEAKLKELEVKE